MPNGAMGVSQVGSSQIQLPGKAECKQSRSRVECKTPKRLVKAVAPFGPYQCRIATSVVPGVLLTWRVIYSHGPIIRRGQGSRVHLGTARRISCISQNSSSKQSTLHDHMQHASRNAFVLQSTTPAQARSERCATGSGLLLALQTALCTRHEC